MTAMITIIPQLSETFMLDGIPHIKMTLTVADYFLHFCYQMLCGICGQCLFRLMQRYEQASKMPNNI